MSDIYPPGTRSHFFPQRCGFLLIDFFFSPRDASHSSSRASVLGDVVWLPWRRFESDETQRPSVGCGVPAAGARGAGSPHCPAPSGPAVGPARGGGRRAARSGRTSPGPAGDSDAATRMRHVRPRQRRTHDGQLHGHGCLPPPRGPPRRTPPCAAAAAEPGSGASRASLRPGGSASSTAGPGAEAAASWRGRGRHRHHRGDPGHPAGGLRSRPEAGWGPGRSAEVPAGSERREPMAPEENDIKPSANSWALSVSPAGWGLGLRAGGCEDSSLSLKTSSVLPRGRPVCFSGLGHPGKHPPSRDGAGAMLMRGK